MKKIRCPKCDQFITFDETNYEEGQSLVFICEHCGKQFSIKIIKKNKKNIEKSADTAHDDDLGHITVLENVFGFRQELKLVMGDNVIGRRCVGTVINQPIDTSDRSIDRIHCIINVNRNKKGDLIYTLRDAPSITGTFLMNEILEDKDRVKLDDGSVITIGAATLILHKAEK
jgi:DNA-directed RNA polymerase subunit M/transcription elongation factor TFIIS